MYSRRASLFPTPLGGYVQALITMVIASLLAPCRRSLRPDSMLYPISRITECTRVVDGGRAAHKLGRDKLIGPREGTNLQVSIV